MTGCLPALQYVEEGLPRSLPAHLPNTKVSTKKKHQSSRKWNGCSSKLTDHAATTPRKGFDSERQTLIRCDRPCSCTRFQTMIEKSGVGPSLPSPLSAAAKPSPPCDTRWDACDRRRSRWISMRTVSIHTGSDPLGIACEMFVNNVETQATDSRVRQRLSIHGDSRAFSGFG